MRLPPKAGRAGVPLKTRCAVGSSARSTRLGPTAPLPEGALTNTDEFDNPSQGHAPSWFTHGLLDSPQRRAAELMVLSPSRARRDPRFTWTRPECYIHVTFRVIWCRCVPLDAVVAVLGC